MQINKKQLELAAQNEIISDEQVDKLYQFLQQQNSNKAQFSFTHVLYYLGGLIAISAMTIFMSLSWEAFGGLGILFICLVYTLVGFWALHKLELKQQLVPAGISAAFIVCLSPLMVFGFLQYFDVWPQEQDYWQPFELHNWHWLSMELATLAVGAVMVKRYKYPFILMPVAAAFWFASNDLLAMFLNSEEIRFSFTHSIYIGLVMLSFAIAVDLRSRQSLDYAFWFYIFGVIAFWIGVSWQHTDLELAKFGYFCLNILLILLGLILTRRIFVVCGGMGVCFYLGHLAFDVFEDSWGFPLALTMIGAGVIYSGLYWQKHELRLTQTLRQKLPSAVKALLVRNE